MKFTDFDIEHFVRFPEEWSTVKKHQILDYIKTDEHASKLCDFYNDLYREIDHLKNDRIYKLDFSFNNVNDHEQVILAADTEQDPSSNLESIASFSTNDQIKLLRVLLINITNTYELHLITDEDQNYEPVIVHFGESHDEFVLNKKGVLKNINRSDLDNVNWEDTVVYLMFPTDEFRYSPLTENSKSFTFSETNLELFDDYLLISVSPKGFTRVLITQHEQTNLHIVGSGTIQSNVDSNAPFQVYLYNLPFNDA
jgi:hypothetical protein